MDLQQSFNALSSLSAISVIAPLTCCILKFKALNKILRALFLYLIISLLAEIAGYITMRNNIHNYFVHHFITVIECSMITYIYLNIFETKKTRILIGIFYFIFLLLAFVTLVIKGRYNQEASLLGSFEACFIISLAFSYFYKEMTELTIVRLNEFYFFWLNSAFLIYFSMGFFLFLFDKFIVSSGMTIFYFLYSLHLLSNITYNILLSIGVWKITRKQGYLLQ